MDALTWLPAKTRRSIEDAVKGLERALGDDLVAALLVGAAASPARPDRAQGPQVLAIARALPPSHVTAIATHCHDAMRAGVRVRALTADELARSADVFALEAAEWRDRHVVLSGGDPFEGLAIDGEDLRRSLEAAARGLVRRLRNRLIADLGTDGRRDDAARAVADAVERSLVLAHHFLATDGPPPEEESELLDSLSEAAGVDGAPAKTLLAELRGKGRLARPVEAAGTLLPWLEGVAAHIDRLGDG